MPKDLVKALSPPAPNSGQGKLIGKRVIFGFKPNPGFINFLAALPPRSEINFRANSESPLKWTQKALESYVRGLEL